MKKKILAIAMAVMCLAGMSACGNKQTPSAPAGSGTTDAAQSTGTPEGSESAQAPETSEATQTGDTIELNYYTWRYSDAYPEKTVFESMKSVYPGITMNVTGNHDSNAYLQQQRVRLLGKDGLDIMSVTPQAYKEYVEAGYLLELTDQPFLDQFTGASLDSVTVDGKIYAVPTAINLIGVWYNMDLFEELDLEVPVTWEDFLNVCEVIKQNGVTPLCNSGKDGWTMEFDIYPFMHKLMVDDPDIFAKVDKGEIKYTDPVFLDTFKEIDEFYKMGYIHPDLVSLAGDASTDMFAKGEVAMVIQGDWFANGLNEKEPEFTVGVFPMPTPGHGDKVVVPLTVGSYDAIASSTEHKEESLQVMEYMSRPENAKSMVTELSAFSPVLNVDVDEGSYLKLWEPLIEYDGVDFFYSRQDTGANSEFLSCLQSMYLGEMTPEEMAENLQTVQDKKEQ